eukprot:4880799-Lingulodinium_polyedra.AAC.1
MCSIPSVIGGVLMLATAAVRAFPFFLSPTWDPPLLTSGTSGTCASALKEDSKISSSSMMACCIHAAHSGGFSGRLWALLLRLPPGLSSIEAFHVGGFRPAAP